MNRINSVCRSFFPRSIRFYSTNAEPNKIPRPSSMNAKTKPAGEGQGPVSWKTLGSVVVFGSIMGSAYVIIKNKKDKDIIKERHKSVGKAAIGGDFELTDHTGKIVTNKSYHGSWLLLYFGFTHCPDICPDEMEKMGEVKNKLKLLSESSPAIDGSLIPLFITVDPARDGVKEVAEYVKEFHPDMIGLTGTMDAVTKAAKCFRVYFSAGEAAYDNDYIVDHTIIMYLINPVGDFVDYYGQNKNADQITKGVVKHMKTYKKINSPSLLDSITNFVFGTDED